MPSEDPLDEQETFQVCHLISDVILEHARRPAEIVRLTMCLMEKEIYPVTEYATLARWNPHFQALELIIRFKSGNSNQESTNEKQA